MYIPIYLGPYTWYLYPNIDGSNDLIEFIKKCFNKDGGIGNYQNSTSYLETVFYGITCLNLLNKIDILPLETIEYISKKENQTGGFGENLHIKPNLFNTFYAIIGLNSSNKITFRIKDNTILYLERFIKNKLIDDRIGINNITSLYWFVIIAKCVMFDLNSIKDSILSFLKSCYNTQKHLFSVIPKGFPSLENTYEALTILKELSALELYNLEKIYNSIISRKQEELYYDNLVDKRTISSTMWAIRSLNILNKINILKQSDCLSYCIKTLNSCESLYDKFCRLNIICNLTYNVSEINYKRTILLFENENSKLYDDLIEEAKKIENRGLDKSYFDFSKLFKNTDINISPDIQFIQIKLNNQKDRLFELEKNIYHILSITYPITRVNEECISTKLINLEKVKFLGVFNQSENLKYGNLEYQIVNDTIKKSNVFRCITLLNSNIESLKEYISKGIDIFYFSGHSYNGKLLINNQELEITKILEDLINNHCSIIIFNCCNTYKYIKNYYINNNKLNGDINIISTISDVFDKQAVLLMMRLFYYIELSFPISEALRMAKKDIWLAYNGLGDTWYSYILFGNPYTIIDIRTNQI